MTDFDRWINIVSNDESDFVKKLKTRYIELTDRYCPNLDEQGKKYLTECETVFHLQSLYNGLAFFIDFLTDEKVGKQLLSDAVERYNGLTGKKFEVKG